MNIFGQNFEFIEEGRDCSYFSEKISDIRYKYLNTCPTNEYQKMLERGWRRFGKMHFVPECKSCTKCVSMRIDVENYQFSKSEKRVIAKNRDTKLYIRPPSVTKDHIMLYNKYHKVMNDKKDWPYYSIEVNEYIKSYVDGLEDYAKEFLYLKDDKLVGVALVDILPQSISSIYCFYDHKYADLSIGKFSILTQIKLAKQLNIPYIYLGYWIKDHLSMGYKQSYSPYEILENRPNLEEVPRWSRYEL